MTRMFLLDHDWTYVVSRHQNSQKLFETVELELVAVALVNCLLGQRGHAVGAKTEQNGKRPDYASAVTLLLLPKALIIDGQSVVRQVDPLGVDHRCNQDSFQDGS